MKIENSKLRKDRKNSELHISKSDLVFYKHSVAEVKNLQRSIRRFENETMKSMDNYSIHKDKLQMERKQNEMQSSKVEELEQTII